MDEDRAKRSYNMQQAMAFPGIDEADAPSSVRPKNAAVSCSHFWACALVVVGLVELVLGTIIFGEWGSFGSFWVGAVAICTGFAGVYITRSESSGGQATGFYFVLSMVTLATSTVSVILGDGAAYLAVRETEGNCFETDSCAQTVCENHDCVCYEPDSSSACSGGTSMRYCFQYGGERCSDIEDSEGLLFGSLIALLIIVLLSICSLLASVSTYWFCKRVIVVESSNSAGSSPSYRP